MARTAARHLGRLVAETQPPPRSFWREVPIDAGLDQWRTVGFQRRILVVVRTVTTLTRLLDVLTLFDNDHRVQVVFTFDEHTPAILGAGVAELLRSLRVPVVPWRQATETRFDLAIAASENDDLHLLDAPIVLLPHGMGYQKYYPGGTVIAGMTPERLVRNGRVVPAAIAVSHADQLDQIRRASPRAANRAVVIGDPCLDRLTAGCHRAPDYRAALGARDGSLVVLASTWGPESLLGTHPELPLRLVSELPYDEFAVCAVLHPGITAAHSHWQVEAWLAQAQQAGLRLIPPDTGWQAAITAASCVLVDEGSLALYAAALDRPVVLAAENPTTTVPGSPMAALAARAPRLAHDEPLAPQIEAAVRRHAPGDYATVIEQAVAFPGQAAARLRALCYELMRLPEPSGEAELAAHPVPPRRPADIPAFVVGAVPRDTGTELTRFAVTSFAHELDFQHVAAHATRASLKQLSAAAIVFTDLAEDDISTFDTWAEATLRRWPDAGVAAARTPAGRCLATNREGRSYELEVTRSDADPLLAASLVHLGRTGAVERIVVGRRAIRVAIRVRRGSRPRGDDRL